MIKGRITNIDYWENDALVEIGTYVYFFGFGSYKVTSDKPPSVMDALESLIAQKTTITIEMTIEV